MRFSSFTSVSFCIVLTSRSSFDRWVLVRLLFDPVVLDRFWFFLKASAMPLPGPTPGRYGNSLPMATLS
jgi:hypothetical protein